MIYMKLQGNVFPMFEGDVRLENPSMGDSFTLPEGYVEVFPQDDPTYDDRSQVLEYGVPYEENGVWKVDKVARQMHAHELEEATALPSSLEENPEIAKIMEEIEIELGLRV